MGELNAQAAAIAINKKLAVESYIKQCGKFQVGDAIFFRKYNGELLPGVISETRVSTTSNNIEYTAVKLKKDGTISQHGLGFWNYEDRYEKRD